MHQTWDDFNYSIFVFAGALLIAATYWFLPKSWGGARHFFTGPVRPEDVQIDENGEFKEQKFIKMPVNNNEYTSTVNPHVSEVNVPKTSLNEHESPDGPQNREEKYYEVPLDENFSSPKKAGPTSSDLA